MQGKTVVFFLLAVSVCSAQTDSMFVRLTNGTTRGYALADIKEITFSGTRTDVKDNLFVRQIIERFTLHQNYPNPFNPSTTVEYEIPKSGPVEVAIFDIQGRSVRQLANSFQQPGVHSLTWNGRNDSGVLVSSGTYLCRVHFENNFLVNKIVLIK